MNDNQYNRGGLGGRFSMIPPVIKSLIIVNVIIHALGAMFFSQMTIGDKPILYLIRVYFGLLPVGDGFHVWQLITYQFLHGDIWHLFFNLFSLWMFGAEIEALWGSRKFLFYYLLCGVGAGFFQLFISPMFGDVGLTIGASGSIYGVLLAFGLTFPRRPIFMFPIFIPIPAIIYVALFAGLAFIMGIGGGGGIAHFAHLGGAVTGFLLFKFGNKFGLFDFLDKIFGGKKARNRDSFGNYYDEAEPRVYKSDWYDEERRPNYSYKPAEPPRSEKFNVAGEEVTQAKIDEILDKISSSGYQSLTEREKNILFELSKKL